MTPLNNGPLQIPADPLEAIRLWLEEAKRASLPEPTAMTLATVDKSGQPSARIVLFKGCSVSSSSAREGIEFYTNYESRKSREMDLNPRAALVFHWVSLRRQVRVEGAVERVSYEESNAYFQTRARDSQIGAWSSPQSRPLKSREELLALVEANRLKFGDKPISCPPFWGGWRLTPSRIEFWEERPNRLHERFELVYRDGAWTKTLLAP